MGVRAQFDLRGKRVFVAGHGGMVGQALLRRLADEDCELLVASREQLDLTDQAATRAWFEEYRPQAVFLAAAKVGGILANMRAPVDFLRDNLLIVTNVMEAADRVAVDKLLFLGSSCIYPKAAAQPIAEEALLSGPLEPTNQWYAIAKIAGIKLAQAYRRQRGRNFISAMPTNLYGPDDDFDLETAHVLAALLRKAHEAREDGSEALVVWGTGTPRREFLHVDDLADACVFLLQTYGEEDPINVGFGRDMPISQLTQKICSIVGFEGEIRFDAGKPDGTPRKLMDCRRLAAMGWQPSITLEEGLRSVYDWYRGNVLASIH